MQKDNLQSWLEEGAREIGVSLTGSAISSFLRYMEELRRWNRKINLTSVVEKKDIIIRHFLDSLAIVPSLGGSKNLLDIGAGAGFPGIPLKIAVPYLQVTLLESTGKKIHFMRHIARVLGLKDIDIAHGRAEAPTIIERYTGGFDTVTSRAFADLGKFLAVAGPFVKTGGTIIAIKGPRSAVELKRLSLPTTLESIGIKETVLPYSQRKSTLLFFKKTRQTTHLSV